MKTMTHESLRELQCRDLMRRGCITIRSDATVSDAIRKMQTAKVSSLLVEPRYKGDAYGIVTRKDILGRAVEPGPQRFNFSEGKVFELMTKPVVTIPPGLKVKYCLRLMKREGVRRLPVFDGKDMVGILSDTDIFKAVRVPSAGHRK